MSTDVVADLSLVMTESIPPDVTTTQYGKDLVFALATVMALAESEAARLTAGAAMHTATGLFLDAHLADHGLRRQLGETDAQAYARLRLPPAAGTTKSIIASVQAILGTDQFRVIELPRDSMYLDRGFGADRGVRAGGARGIVIVIIPASAMAKASVLDAVRSKVSAGKLWVVEEYT